MEFYERASGARLHAAYFRPGGVHQDLPAGLLDDIATFCETFPRSSTISRPADRQPDLPPAHGRYRRHVSAEEAFDWGFTGPMLRGSGVPWDLRRAQPYECYDELDFQIPVGKNGDCFDRYLVPHGGDAPEREDHEAVPREDAGRARYRRPQHQGHAAQAGRDEALDGGADPSLQALHRGLSRARRARPTRRSRRRRASSASTWSPTAPTALQVQDPRAGFRPPGGHGLHVPGHMLADSVAILGSMDIVFGEVDR